MATYDDTKPSDTDIAFPDGAGAIRTTRATLRTILNTMLTANAAPTPPATYANYDSQIPTGGAAVPNPLMVLGDKIDMRGITWRSASPVTRNAINTTASTTYAAATGLQIVMTPASTASVIWFFLQGLIHVYDNTVFSHVATTHYGKIRIYNTTGAAAISREAWFPVNPGAGGGPNVGCYQDAVIIGRTTGISGANTFDVQTATGAVTTTLDIHGDFTPTNFSYLEIV